MTTITRIHELPISGKSGKHRLRIPLSTLAKDRRLARYMGRQSGAARRALTYNRDMNIAYWRLHGVSVNDLARENLLHRNSISRIAKRASQAMLGLWEAARKQRALRALKDASERMWDSIMASEPVKSNKRYVRVHHEPSNTLEYLPYKESLAGMYMKMVIGWHFCSSDCWAERCARCGNPASERMYLSWICPMCGLAKPSLIWEMWGRQLLGKHEPNYWGQSLI